PLDRAGPVGRLGDNDEADVVLDRLAQVRARRRVIVGNQHADLLPHGSSTSTDVPVPRRDFTWSVPPIARARSVMLVKPKPPLLLRRVAVLSKPRPSSTMRS